ncbi:MAG: hypothetical protein JWN44_5717 [Myxococcales bacterium]|nr:hypothetical protein [Myxococcales bacterium]
MTITRDDPRFWDVRTLQRRLRKGQITKKDYEKYLKTIADAAEKQAPIDLSSVDDDEDDYDDADEADEPGPGTNGVHSE